MKIKKTQTILTKIIILSHNKKNILLLKKKWDYWELPGGHIEFEETPEECLIREIKEELGVKVLIDELCNVDTIILDRSKHPCPEIMHYTAIIFIGRIKRDQKLNLSDPDSTEFRWFPIETVIEDKNFKLFEPTRYQIKNILNSKAIRANKKYYIKMGEIQSYKIG